jgi:NADP-dependent 3-hydroxy acid dehydrogenase YdfG
MANAASKTVLVTGASSGIGEAAALALAARGHRVLAGVRREADAKRIGAGLGASGQPLLLDVTRPEQIEAAPFPDPGFAREHPVEHHVARFREEAHGARR